MYWHFDNKIIPNPNKTKLLEIIMLINNNKIILTDRSS